MLCTTNLLLICRFVSAAILSWPWLQPLCHPKGKIKRTWRYWNWLNLTKANRVFINGNNIYTILITMGYSVHDGILIDPSWLDFVVSGGAGVVNLIDTASQVSIHGTACKVDNVSCWDLWECLSWRMSSTGQQAWLQLCGALPTLVNAGWSLPQSPTLVSLEKAVVYN